MIVWGVNALNHGSSFSVFENNNLKNFEKFSSDTLDYDSVRKSFNNGGPSVIYWYENPWLKKARQMYAGQWNRVFDCNDLPGRYLKTLNVGYAKLRYTPHHASHAAAGYYTSPFDDCAVVVLDAIGEFECATIWHARDGGMKKVWRRVYPHSLGLFYSAYTQFIGYQPVRDEYLLEKDSTFGDRFRFDMTKHFSGTVKLKDNFHRGVSKKPLVTDNVQIRLDYAASVQKMFEQQVEEVMKLARSLTGSENLVYMGGCAMNRKCNDKISNRWKHIWSLPDPGDGSSSLGAVLYHTRQRITDWNFGVVKHIDIRV